LVGSNSGSISTSTATGTVTSTGSGSFVGGLVGQLGEEQGGTVSNSSAHGDVTGGEQVGGLVGKMARFGSNVQHSFSTGTVSGDSKVGGLIGSKSAGTTTDLYWDVESSDQDNATGDSDGPIDATGLNMTEMTGVNATENMDGFAFTGTWHVTDSYPALAAQNTAPYYEVTVESTNAPVATGETLSVTVTVANVRDNMSEKLSSSNST